MPKVVSIPLSLQRLLGPIEKDVFLEKYYEKTHLHIHRNEDGHYNDLLSLEELNDYLISGSAKYPEVKLVQAGESILEKDYANASHIINPLKLFRRFGEGATIVLSGMQLVMPKLGKLCDALMIESGHKFQTNLYLTPPNSQGFPVHYDDHDVFVLQITGNKLWKIYDQAVDLPTKSMRFNPDQTKAGMQTDEFLMQPGDMLYVPRGLMHEALSDDTGSLHITLGLIGFTWADFIKECIESNSKHERILKKNLPFGYHQNDKINQTRILLSGMDNLTVNLGAGDSAEVLFNHLMKTQIPKTDSYLKYVLNRNELDESKTFLKRPSILFQISESPDIISIHFYDQTVEFPVYVKEAVEFICKATEFRIHDIPDCIDHDGKLVLIERLIKDGFIIVNE